MLCLLAAGACGGQSPVERTVVETGADGLLVSYEAGNHLHRYGGRVFADGRYELFTASGQQRPGWTSYEPFTPDQVEEIRGAVDEALAAELPDRVSADPPRWTRRPPASRSATARSWSPIGRRTPRPSSSGCSAGSETCAAGRPCPAPGSCGRGRSS